MAKYQLIITTTHVKPPIPIRTHDWSAHFGELDIHTLFGWGSTEQEAIEDLIADHSEQLHDYLTKVEE